MIVVALLLIATLETALSQRKFKLTTAQEAGGGGGGGGTLRAAF